ncbi:GmrSD restriction endonuclease domain-containing protein [Helicobacter sp. 23-1048]
MEQPKPTNEKYSKIIERIADGSYQIPKFQRDFVWDKEKTANLIDSLLKGFPIGSFIVWKTKERLKSLKKLGGKILKEIKEGVDIYYVLDGQQRMTSLFLALTGEKTDKFDYKNLYIDLDKDIDDDEQICVLEKTENSISFYNLMRQDPFDLQDTIGKENARKCKTFKDRIEKYEFSIIEIENLPLEKIADIFTRINTSGKALTLFEIMNAKIYTETKDGQNGFDLEDKFNELINDLAEANYESIADNKQFILQLISAKLQKNTKRESILSIPKDRFIDEWDESIKGFKLAVDYARNFLKIPVSKLLPYPALLVPIAYFFRINGFKQPNNAQAKLLSKYFFRSTFSWRFSSATETKLNADIKLIEKIKDSKEIDFQKEIPTDSKEDFISRLYWNFSAGNAFDKGVLCIMAYAEPKSFNNNANVRLDNSHLSIATSKNFHHFFPKAYLKRKKQDKYVNALANITLVDDYLNKREIKDKEPKKYIQEFQNDNPNLKATLKTHFIDLDTFGIWENDYDTFLQKRAEKLADEIIKRI